VANKEARSQNCGINSSMLKTGFYFLIGAMQFVGAFAIAEIPVKKIEKTPYCSHIERIDQAKVIDPSEAKFVDYLVVSKSRRKLYALNRGRLVKAYDVAFGSGFNEGPKASSGDGRTPEGLYNIDLKNPDSKYHLSLHVSYPSEKDKAFAKANNISNPGGNIMVHGFPNDPSKNGGKLVDDLDPAVIRTIHPEQDWTQGCIAVTNDEIEEIFSLVKITKDVKVPIEICPLK